MALKTSSAGSPNLFPQMVFATGHADARMPQVALHGRLLDPWGRWRVDRAHGEGGETLADTPEHASSPTWALGNQPAPVRSAILST